MHCPHPPSLTRTVTTMATLGTCCSHIAHSDTLSTFPQPDLSRHNNGDLRDVPQPRCSQRCTVHILRPDPKRHSDGNLRVRATQPDLKCHRNGDTVVRSAQPDLERHRNGESTSLTRHATTIMAFSGAEPQGDLRARAAQPDLTCHHFNCVFRGRAAEWHTPPVRDLLRQR